MIISHVRMKNWRNFKSVDVPLQERQFIIGANASGKSNFLDVFRFLRDIAITDGGGLQKALKDRGGVSKVRSLAARSDPNISIEVHLADAPGDKPLWRYCLGVRQETRGRRQTLLTKEAVWKGNTQVLDRPDEGDKRDPERLTQTSLEQINTNGDFREVGQYLQKTTYLHLVPQLLRFAESFRGHTLEKDPFGQSFLERIASTSARTRRSRLVEIESALRVAVPQLQKLEFKQDEITGHPHLQALYAHWRPNAGWQREDQFSDGTLRLIGLLWSLLEGDSLLLLEEPELSLNDEIVKQLAPLIHRVLRARRRQRQILVSTHSYALLNDPGIDGREVLLLSPESEGTIVQVASNIPEVRALLDSGLSVGEAALPKTRPRSPNQLTLIR